MLSASKKYKEYDQNILLIKVIFYNHSAVEHYDFNMHPCCKKLSENKFTKASEQTLDRQHNKNLHCMLTFRYFKKIRHILT